MPNITFDAAGEHAASGTIAAASDEQIQILNATNSTIVGTVNLADAMTLEIIDTANRRSDGVTFINADDLGFLSEDTTADAGTDIQVRLAPGANFIYRSAIAGNTNILANSFKPSHGTGVGINGQNVYFNLIDALT